MKEKKRSEIGGLIKGYFFGIVVISWIYFLIFWQSGLLKGLGLSVLFWMSMTFSIMLIIVLPGLNKLKEIRDERERKE